MTPSAWRVVKWTLISYASIAGLGAAILAGAVLYVMNTEPSSCDSGVLDSIQAEKACGDTARAEIEICILFATVVNTSISLQLRDGARLLPKKTLIDYSEADDAADPVLRWIDDNTLSVDLGKVSWASSRFTRWGPVRIIYSYEVINRPASSQ